MADIDATPISESPYAPPKSHVADALPTGPTPDRPAQVNRAVKVLWLMFSIGIVAGIWRLAMPSPQIQQLSASSSMYQTPVMVGFMLVGFLFAAWLYRAIGQGRNWALILYLILNVFSLLSIPLTLFNVSKGLQTVPQVTLSFFNIALGLYVCYLLLTAPAKAWFKGMKDRA